MESQKIFTLVMEERGRGTRPRRRRATGAAAGITLAQKVAVRPLTRGQGRWFSGG